jgi:hypothetical protein
MSSTAVFAALGACRTPGDVVPAAAFGVGNVAENLEALVLASNGGQLGPRFRRDWVRDGHHSGGEGVEVLPCEPPYLAKELELRVKGRFGGNEPVALHAGAMDPKRTADCVPKFAGLEFVLARKYFDAVLFVPFDRDAESARDMQDIEPAQFRRQRLRQEYPEVATPAGLLHQGLYAVFAASLLEPEQITAGVSVVGIDRNPL